MPRPRPPLVAGVVAPGLGDKMRVTWWMLRGWWHGARAGHGAGRVMAGLLVVLWWVEVPLIVPLQLYRMSRGHARYYLSAERDAVLAVVTTRKGWHVQDHLSARPGRGQGKALRARILPELLYSADELAVRIYATAATAKLAARYINDLPGLVDVGRGVLGGRRLCREPRSPSCGPLEG